MKEAGDLQKLGDILDGAGVPVPQDVSRLVAAWGEVVGEENAQNAHPRSLKGGRLTVATSSSVWAQTLQFMSEDIRRRLNAALGSEVVRDILFRPAGWDPGGGRGAPRPLASAASPGRSPSRGRGSSKRRLTAEEEAAVAEVRRTACDGELGEQMARTMRAALSRSRRG